LTLFVKYSWPGNVRELRNIIERLIIMSPGQTISVSDVPPPLNRESAARKVTEGKNGAESYLSLPTLKEARSNFEREYLVRKLKENDGNVSKTADMIGVERSNLHRKIKALDIELED
jgi:two-component system nitrogen regulation response regulator NtrX